MRGEHLQDEGDYQNGDPLARRRGAAAALRIGRFIGFSGFGIGIDQEAGGQRSAGQECDSIGVGQRREEAQSAEQLDVLERGHVERQEGVVVGAAAVVAAARRQNERLYVQLVDGTVVHSRRWRPARRHDGEERRAHRLAARTDDDVDAAADAAVRRPPLRHQTVQGGQARRETGRHLGGVRVHGGVAVVRRELGREQRHQHRIGVQSHLAVAVESTVLLGGAQEVTA